MNRYHEQVQVFKACLTLQNKKWQHSVGLLANYLNIQQLIEKYVGLGDFSAPWKRIHLQSKRSFGYVRLALFHPRHPMMILCTGNNDIVVFNTCDWSYRCIIDHETSTLLFNIRKIVCHPYLPQIICWDPLEGDLIATVDLITKQIFHKKFIPKLMNNQGLKDIQISGDGQLVATVFSTKKYNVLSDYSFARKALKGLKNDSKIRLMTYDGCVKLDKGEHNYLEQIACPGLRVKQTLFAPQFSLFFFWSNKHLYAYQFQNKKFCGRRLQIPLFGDRSDRFIRNVSFDPNNKRQFLVCTNTYVSLFAVYDNTAIQQIGFASETGLFGWSSLSLPEIKMISFHPTMNYVHQLGVKALGHHIRSMEDIFIEWPQSKGLHYVARDIQHTKVEKWMRLDSTIRTDCMRLTFHPLYPVAVVYRTNNTDEYVAVINLQKLKRYSTI